MPHVGNRVTDEPVIGRFHSIFQDIEFVPAELMYGKPKDSKNPADYEQKWKFTFKTDTGRLVWVRTKVDYGGSRATLTKLLNGMFSLRGGNMLTEEQFTKLDFYKFQNHHVYLTMLPNEDGTGSVFGMVEPHPDYPVTPEMFFEDANTMQPAPQQMAPQAPTRPVQAPQAPGRVANPFGASAGQQSADF